MTTNPVADHLEILNLEGRYTKTWDEKDPEGWADVFTPDGVFEIVAKPGTEGVRAEGREHLVAFARLITSNHEATHLPALPYVEIDGDEATGRVNFHAKLIARFTPDHQDTLEATGHYDVKYRRTPDGWRMTERLEKPFIQSRTSFWTD